MFLRRELYFSKFDVKGTGDMKIIFLDIDGVLNYQGCPEILYGSYFVEDEKIALLKQIVDATGAKIVLSSSWRDGWCDQENGEETVIRDMYEALVEKLKEYGLELYDKTPYEEDRATEIAVWLDDSYGCKGDFVDDFVILDDLAPENFGKYLAEHLAHTDFMDGGLKEEHVRQAIEILNR